VATTIHPPTNRATLGHTETAEVGHIPGAIR
jgi:hypothetical protein